jgi:hypothetical protein
MTDDIWEYYAKDMMFESHKEPHYVTQQYIKFLEAEKIRLETEIVRLNSLLSNKKGGPDEPTLIMSV